MQIKMQTGIHQNNIQLNELDSERKIHDHLDTAYHTLSTYANRSMCDGRKYYIRFRMQDDETTKTVSLDFFLLDPTECCIKDYWICSDRALFAQFKNKQKIYITDYKEMPDHVMNEIILGFEIYQVREDEGYFIAIRVE